MPKKREFEQIDLPKKSYHIYNKELPYSFDIPDYAVVEEDRSKGAEPYWINIHYPEMRASLHLSYKTIDKKTPCKIWFTIPVCSPTSMIW